jgi:hypothetical protein
MTDQARVLTLTRMPPAEPDAREALSFTSPEPDAAGVARRHTTGARPRHTARPDSDRRHRRQPSLPGRPAGSRERRDLAGRTTAPARPTAAATGLETNLPRRGPA